MDNTTTIAQLKEKMALFIKDREWEQFHSPKNVSMQIAVEAAELMEKFIWITTQESYNESKTNATEIKHELADVFMGILCFCNATGIDLSRAFEEKLALTADKYPIELSKGCHTKYTKLKKNAR